METLIESLQKPMSLRISLSFLDSGLRWNDGQGIIQRFPSISEGSHDVGKGLPTFDW